VRHSATGADPPFPLIECCRIHPGRFLTGARSAKTAEDHSERCCGIPASSARTSVSRYRRCPPSVRIEVSLPAFAHRVTVLGSTRNIVATSAGVNSGSASGVRADICVASPPGPVLRSCLSCCLMLHGERVGDVQIWPDLGTILPSPAVTRRPPGAKFLYRDVRLLHRAMSLRVSLVILFVASRRIRGISARPACGQPPRRRPTGTLQALSLLRGPNPAHAIRLVPIPVQRGTGTG
jgi:hypothetical protein